MGNFSLAMAPKFTNSTFYGVDISERGILEAREKATSRGITNVRFQVEDAAQLPHEWSDKFDAIFLFDVLHDIPFATKACAEISRVLKAGCHCVIRDLDIHSDPQEQKKKQAESPLECYTYSLVHCLPMSMNTENSEALGTCLGLERIAEMMETTGLKHIPSAGLRLPEDGKHALVFVK